MFIRRNLINTSSARRDGATSESQERRELKSSLQSLNDRKLSRMCVCVCGGVYVGVRTAIKLSYKMTIKTLQEVQDEGQLSRHLGLVIM